MPSRPKSQQYVFRIRATLYRGQKYLVLKGRTDL